jgi:hypothetical protein
MLPVRPRRDNRDQVGRLAPLLPYLYSTSDCGLGLIAPGHLGSAMVKPFGADDELECPQCKGMMRVVRRKPHPARKEYEQQALECASCEYTNKRTVDAGGRVQR